jgi:short-subunit dehydrogenase
MTISTSAPTRPAAVVTGASSGIGAAFARRLAADGHDLVLVARRGQRLESLARRLRLEHGTHAVPLVADLGTSAGCEAAAAQIQTGPAPAIVVNSAGFAGYGPFVDLTSDELEALLAVHVQAVARLTHAAAAAMAARGGGAIVNVTSRLALSGTLAPNPLPYRALYAGAKAFQLAFSQTLATELIGSGIRVQALLPGLVRTEFHRAAALAVPPHLVLEPEEIVEASLAALERGEVVCAPGLANPELLGVLGKVERAIVMDATPSPT